MLVWQIGEYRKPKTCTFCMQFNLVTRTSRGVSLDLKLRYGKSKVGVNNCQLRWIRNSWYSSTTFNVHLWSRRNLFWTSFTSVHSSSSREKFTLQRYTGCVEFTEEAKLWPLVSTVSQWGWVSNTITTNNTSIDCNSVV